jgi:methyl-accepting chemotaxis protein
VDEATTIKTLAVMLGASTVVAGVLFAAAMWHASKFFASSKDVESSLKRVHRRVDENRDSVQGAVSLLAGIDDRTGDLEEKVSVLEERQSQQWARISEQMHNTASTLRDVMKEVKDVATVTHELAIRMERIQNGGGR